MSKITDYTLEVYKADRRTKEGRRFIEKVDITEVSTDRIQLMAERRRSQGYQVEVYETYVTRKNLMSGTEYQERYDQPYYCSPSSEAYWSM